MRKNLCYKLVIVIYIKPTTIYKTMKLIKHPNDRLFLVRLFIMLLLVLCTRNYIIYEFMDLIIKLKICLLNH